jgi:hypothetical protein
LDCILSVNQEKGGFDRREARKAGFALKQTQHINIGYGLS